MIPAQDYAKTLRTASDAGRHQALVNSIMTPELRKLIEDQGKRMSEALNLQIKVRDVLPPSMEALMREQNQRIAEMFDTLGMRKALAGINFNLPDGWAEQLAAYREQLAEEVTGDHEIADARGGFGRFAEDREAIITCLQRIGFALEGFSYFPRSPIPPIVGYLILMLAVLGQVADEKLSEREVDDY